MKKTRIQLKRLDYICNSRLSNPQNSPEIALTDFQSIIPGKVRDRPAHIALEH